MSHEGMTRSRGDWKPVVQAAGFSLALLGLIFACRWNMLFWPFLASADLPHALGNPAIRSWKNLPFLFSSSYCAVFWEGSYHPLYTFTTFVNYAIFGLNPMGFRIFKIVIVWLNALLLSKAVRKELGAWAWAAAFFYACHPCHSETAMLAVKDELVALFCLLGLLAHRRAGPRNYPAAYGLLVGICNGLALASKETGVVFPALLLTMDVAQQRIPGGRAQRRRWLSFYGICAGVTVLYVLLRFRVITGGGDCALGYSKIAHLAGILTRLKGYAGALTALPWQGLGIYTPLIYAALVGGVFWLAGKGQGKFAAGCLAWICFGILPMSGLLPVEGLSHYLAMKMAGEPVPCYYLVLPGVGYAWLLGLGLRESLGRKRWIAGALSLAFFLFPISEQILGGRQGNLSMDPCRRQGGQVQGGWSCSKQLTYILISLPFMKSRFPEVYAGYHIALRDLLGARASPVEEYFGAILEHPCQTAQFIRRLPWGDFDRTWRGIQGDGAIQESRELLGRGRTQEAFEKLETARRLDPSQIDGYFEKAVADYQLGNLPAAREEYEKYRLMARRPDMAGPRCPEVPLDRSAKVLLNVVMQRRGCPGADSAGEREKALLCLRQVAQLTPADAGRYIDLGAKTVGLNAVEEREWRRLSRRAFGHLVIAEGRTPACDRYDFGRQGEVPGRVNNRPPPASLTAAKRWIGLAETAAVVGKRQLAMDYLKRVRGTRPVEEDNERIAILYQRLGKYRWALAVLERLLQDHPRRAKARWLSDRGVVKALMGRVPEAEDDFRAAIAKDREFWPAYYSLGALYSASGNRAEALNVYKEAMRRMGPWTKGELPGLIRLEYEKLGKASPGERK